MFKRISEVSLCLSIIIIFSASVYAGTSDRNVGIGKVIGWGSQMLPFVEAGTEFTSVAARLGHSLALEEDGNVVAWGENSHGQSTVPEGLKDVKEISAGVNHSLALKKDGTVVAWGKDSHGCGIGVGPRYK